MFFQVAECLTIIINNGLSEGTVLKQWKTATVILLYKKGNKSKQDNYRPISLLLQSYHHSTSATEAALAIGFTVHGISYQRTEHCRITLPLTFVVNHFVVSQGIMTHRIIYVHSSLNCVKR